MSSPAKQLCLNEAVLKTLQYFHIFRHPLHFDEIYRFCGVKVNRKELKLAVDDLVAYGQIFLIDGFYLLEKNVVFVKNRKKGATRAQMFILHAQK